MLQKVILAIIGFVIGIGVAYGIFFLLPYSPLHEDIHSISVFPNKKVIGFLPYWLLSQAKTDYSSITQLSYFGLTIGVDGHIQKFEKPGESDPGWFALQSGKVDPFLQAARDNHQSLSLLVFSGDQDAIDSLMKHPITHAKNLMHDVSPLMRQYHFTDLNIDIERVGEASASAQQHYTLFLREVKRQMQEQKLGTVTIDMTGDSFIKHNLIDPSQIAPIADFVVVMAYDFHFIGSYVTGPVAPLAGVSTVVEYDIQTAIQKSLAVLPSEKIILGLPLYGYEWETLSSSPRSAVVPGSGLTASTKRVQELLASCTNCHNAFDEQAKE